MAPGKIGARRQAQCVPRRALPILAIVASSLGFSLQALLVKKLIVEGGIGTFQIIVFRGTMQAVFCVSALALWGVPSREWLGTQAVQIKMLCLRSALGFCGIAFGFLAISMLPLGDASTLMQSAPVWSSLMAVVFLGERWHCVEVLCAFGALLGVVLVMRPDPLVALLGGDPAAPSLAPSADGRRLLGSLCALAGAFSAGGVFVVVRWLGTVVQTRTPTVILYQALGQVILAPALVVASGQGWVLPSAGHGLQLVTVGCLGFASQLVLTYGLQREKSAVATPFKMTDVVFAFLWQATLVPRRAGERVVQATSVAGACVIIFSMTINVLAKLARDRDDAKRGLLPGHAAGPTRGMVPATPASWEEGPAPRMPVKVVLMRELSAARVGVEEGEEQQPRDGRGGPMSTRRLAHETMMERVRSPGNGGAYSHLAPAADWPD